MDDQTCRLLVHRIRQKQERECFDEEYLLDLLQVWNEGVRPQSMRELAEKYATALSKIPLGVGRAYLAIEDGLLGVGHDKIPLGHGATRFSPISYPSASGISCCVRPTAVLGYRRRAGDSPASANAPWR